MRDRILVECVKYAFFIYIDYESLPFLCESCKVVGHYTDTCRKYSNDHGIVQFVEDLVVVKKYLPKNTIALNKVKT